MLWTQIYFCTFAYGIIIARFIFHKKASIAGIINLQSAKPVLLSIIIIDLLNNEDINPCQVSIDNEYALCRSNFLSLTLYNKNRSLLIIIFDFDKRNWN